MRLSFYSALAATALVGNVGAIRVAKPELYEELELAEVVEDQWPDTGTTDLAQADSHHQYIVVDSKGHKPLETVQTVQEEEYVD